MSEKTVSEVAPEEVEAAAEGGAEAPEISPEDANRDPPDPTTGYAPLKFKDPMELDFWKIPTKYHHVMSKKVPKSNDVQDYNSSSKKTKNPHPSNTNGNADHPIQNGSAQKPGLVMS
jgi:hypothetical protein